MTTTNNEFNLKFASKASLLPSWTMSGSGVYLLEGERIALTKRD